MMDHDSHGPLDPGEAKFKTLAEQSPHMIFINRRGAVVYANRKCSEIMGYSPEEFLATGFDFRALIAPEFRELIEKNFQAHQQGLEVPPYEYALLTKQGARVEVMITTKLIDYEGERAILGVVTDISARKRAEDALKKLNEELEKKVQERTATLQASESKYRALFEGSSDAVMLLDKNRFFDANQATLEMFGTSQEEFVRFHPSEISPPQQPDGEDSRTKADRMIAIAFEKGRNFFEWTHRRKNGQDFPTEVLLTALHFQDRPVLQATVRDISERKRLEAVLVESEEKFRSLFNAVTDGILIADAETKRFVLSNSAISRMLGYSQEELRHLGVADIHPPEDLSLILEKFETLRQAESTWVPNIPVRRKDNSAFHVDISGSSVKLRGRTYLVGVFKDITERRRAEEEIRSIKQQIEFILGATKTGLDIIDQDYNLRYIDPEWQKVYGDPAGRKCYEYFMGLPEPCPNCAIQRAFETQRIVVSEEKLVKEGGRPVQVTSIPYRGPGGEWLVAEVNVDISQRKVAEEQLRVQGELLRNVIEHVPHFVFWKDLNGVFLGCNQNLARVAGFSSPEEVIGKTDYDMPWKKEESDYYRKCDREVMESGQAMLDIEEPQLQADGREAVLLTSKVPLRDEEGNVIGLLGIFADITEIKRREALAAKSEFLSMVSHELRTPLHCIAEGISIVLEGLTGKINKKQKDILETSRKSVERLSRLVNSALQFQKLEIETVAFSLGHHDINEMVRGVKTMMETFIKNKKVRFLLRLEPNIPRIKCDRDKILQVLWNLIHNAFKFTTKGSVTVTTSLNEKGRSVKICVHDTGPGLRKEEIEKIFSRPQEVSIGRKKKKAEGMGLGLAISKKIVERHGGHIEAESTYGQGSTFSFTLPVV